MQSGNLTPGMDGLRPGLTAVIAGVDPGLIELSPLDLGLNSGGGETDLVIGRSRAIR